MDARTIFRDQGGVATRSDLVQAGLSARQIERYVADGRLTRLRNGWVATPEADPAIAAAVTIGGVLTCVSEARRRGIFARDDGRLHIAVRPNAGRFRSVAGVSPVVHWGNETVSRRRGATSDPLDNALAQIADCQPSDWAVASIDSAMRVDRSVNPDRLGRIASSAKTDRLKGLLSHLDARAESGLESLLRVRLAQVGVAMRLQVQIDGYRVDGLIGDRLIIEADGYEFHGARSDFERDHIRATQLQALGYLILRFTYLQIVNEWPSVLAAIHAAMARGQHLWIPLRHPAMS